MGTTVISPRALRRLTLGVAAVLGVLSVGAGAMGAWLIYSGANPAPGEGSLGHVGMIIAGLILELILLLLGGLGLLLLSRARRAAGS